MPDAGGRDGAGDGGADAGRASTGAHEGSEIPIEKRFAVLSEITRAQHFAWRKAVSELFPGADVQSVVERMWEITGDQTAAAYNKRLDINRPMAPQVAASIVWSSQCMGEDAVLTHDASGQSAGEPSTAANEAFVRHRDCPWVHWHRRNGAVAEDQPGCDAWFRSTLDAVNRACGSRLAFETLESLPEGGMACVRRIYDEGR